MSSIDINLFSESFSTCLLAGVYFVRTTKMHTVTKQPHSEFREHAEKSKLPY